MVIDINGTLLGALELVYEQSRPEVRGLWREHVDPYLRIRADNRPDLGDWERPWLGLEVVPIRYLDHTQEFRHGGPFRQEPGLLHDRPDARLAAMDADGVEVVVLHPASFAGPAAALSNTRLGCGLLAGYNRYLGTYCRPEPTRLMGSIQLHGLHPDWSLLELRRLARRRWVAGASVRVPADVPVWDPCLRPIFAALEDADLPLFHCSELYDSPGFPGHDDLWSDPHLAMTLGPSWDSQRQLTALVVGSVLDRHSRLKVCVLDGGVGWVPAWLDRLTYVSAQAGAAAKALLREGRITLTIAPHESERTVAAAVEVLGDRCLVWGSAFPRGEHRGPAQVRHWRSIRAESVLATNALRLLGLPHTEVQQQKKESTP